MAAQKSVEVKLVSEIIEAHPGVKRAFHVFTPALQYRLENNASGLPVMALRSSIHNFSKMKLYVRIECLGPSSLDPLFDSPLPGTGGRGVAIMFTEFPLRVWYPEGQKPTVIDTPDGRNPKEILEEVKLKYELAFHDEF
jgi:hypothetical protein